MENIHNCLLVGETGSGKSSFGNFAVGKEDAFFVSDDALSCTKNTIRIISQLDPNISIVDTPGLQDSSGSDKIHYEQMLKIIKEMKYLHFILIVINFTSPRFTASMQYMIKFLCNVFPKNFAHHVGIIFTHYDHDYQVKINKKKNRDPRENREELIRNIMELISHTTNEELFLGPPKYFLDSYIEDDNSKAELNRLIAFAKTLNPIEDIRECNIKHKKEEEEFEERNREQEEGNYIVTYRTKYSRIKYTDYDNNITYSDWKELNTEKSYRSIPVRYETVYVSRKDDDEDKKKKEEENMRLKEREEEERQKINDKLDKLKTCNKIVEAGGLGYIGSVLLGIGGALLTPTCPVVGPMMVEAAVAGMTGSAATSVGGGIVSKIISNS